MMIEQENDQMHENTPRQSSPGSLLRKAREAKKVSLSDTATELRLTVQRVSDIENDRFSDMGATTFAKGYLRSYARFVGVSEEEVLQAFEHSGFESDIPSYKPKLLNEKMADSNAKGSRRLAYIIVLLLAIVLAVGWYHRETVTQTFFNSDSSAMQNRSEKNNAPTAINQTSTLSSAERSPAGTSQYGVDLSAQNDLNTVSEPVNSLENDSQSTIIAPQSD